MQNIYQKIIDFLNHKKIEYETIDHEPVFTSEQAARVRGLSMQQGAKSLLLKAGNDYFLAVLPGDKKLDSKKAKKLLGVKDLRFAKPDEVKTIMHCEVGACYPFGNLIGVRMLVDNNLSKNEVISFNPGVHNKSIKMEWVDYYNAVNPELGDISI